MCTQICKHRASFFWHWRVLRQSGLHTDSLLSLELVVLRPDRTGRLGLLLVPRSSGSISPFLSQEVVLSACSGWGRGEPSFPHPYLHPAFAPKLGSLEP